MPGFDILAGPSLYDGVVGGTPNGTPNFDILAPNPTGRPVPGQGQNGAAPNGLQPNGQPQGAPVSGLVAGLMGAPTYGGAVPGAAYLTSGQAQANGGQQMSPEQAQQLQQLLQMGGLPTGNPAAPAQPQNIGSAVGSGLRSLFDGVVGSGR